MLLELHVRNFALIAQADLQFREGLNVLSGETGTGKSILIDSIAAALGGKAGREMIRTGADSAYIELVFEAEEWRLPELRELGVEPESGGLVIVSRQLSKNRSVFRVNDRTVTSALLRRLAGLLIDIHGQHEVQTLFEPAAHLRCLDLMAGAELAEEKEAYARSFRRYASLKERLKADAGESVREREKEILDYEIREISEAELKEGEEEEIQAAFTRSRNAWRVKKALGEAAESLGGDAISKALREVSEAEAYAPELSGLAGQLSELENLAEDALRELRERLEETEVDEGAMKELSERLDLIRRLEDKYGADVPAIQLLLEEKQRRLDELSDFEANRESMLSEEAALREELRGRAALISSLRRKSAAALEKKVAAELRDLNFRDSSFSVVFSEREEFSAEGLDRAEFYISANPGEPQKPLRAVASGGELSRIMLALKTVLAEKDATGSMIFDEIDAGISGRTAQAVSEKLHRIGRARQVLCITHLPQIAAMADHHYLIEKESGGGRTETAVREIHGGEITGELGRLIGGSVITEGVLQTAAEMKRLADRAKKNKAEAEGKN